jgi:lipopolysaccharide assembly protein A
MTIVRWVVGSGVFLLLLIVSLKNSDQATLWFFGWGPWQAPLILVLLIAFAVGVTAGLLVGAVRTARLRRQLNRLRRGHAKQVGASPEPLRDGR